MIKEWLVKGAKEAEEHTLCINAADSNKSKKKQVIRSPSTMPAQEGSERGSGRVSSEYTVGGFYVVNIYSHRILKVSHPVRLSKVPA